MGDPCCCLDMLSHIDEDSASLRAAAGWGWHVATHPLWPRLGWLADGWWEMMDGLSHLHSNQESRSEGWEWYIGASYLPNSGIFFCHFWHTVSTTFTVNAGNLLVLKKQQKHSTGQREFSAQLSVSTSRHKQMASEKTSITKVSWSDRNDSSLLYQLRCHALRSNTEIFNAWPVGGQTDFP